MIAVLSPWTLIARNAAGATVVVVPGLAEDDCKKLLAEVLPKASVAASAAIGAALNGVVTGECWR